MTKAVLGTSGDAAGPMGKLFLFARSLKASWIIALTPGLCLGAYAALGKPGLMAMALGAPLIIIGTIGSLAFAKGSEAVKDPVTGLGLRQEAVARLDARSHEGAVTDRSVACFAVGIEEFERITSRHGDRAAQHILYEAARRLEHTIRESDVAVRLDGPRFGVALTQLRRVDLEMAIEIAARMQAAISEPFAIDGAKAFLGSSVGFCLPPIAPSTKGEGLMSGAERALDEAMSITGGAIRRYSEDMRKRDHDRSALRQEAHDALADGRVVPWFQPQVSTDTGRVTGVEVLARWEDPEKGLISPADFLPALEGEGLLDRLGEVMLAGALQALKAWDDEGLEVPSVGLNVTETELRNPRFCDRVKWELDRHEIAPNRLTLEVLETVTNDGADDMVSRNLAALARLGCRLDLDDFGTGNASLASIRRFNVNRLKIDRSYVTDVDTEPAQQSLVAAIVTMAERLDLETLAEGVETLGEHAMVAQLGCLHAQGFAISRPLPQAAFGPWLKEHQENVSALGLPGLKASVADPRGRGAGTGKTA